MAGDRARTAGVIMASACLAAACACTGPGTGDGPPPPDQRPDPSTLAEPVPRDEPLSEQGNPERYTVAGRTYHVRDTSEGYVARGKASWYGTKFHGRRTSSGEIYDMNEFSAAHKTLPLPSYVRVTRLDNGRSVVVRVNDRGPFVDDRLIDLSYAAAAKLGIAEDGVTKVEVRALTPEGTAEGGPATTRPPDEQGASSMMLQVGAFSKRANAEALRRRLETRTPKVTIRAHSSERHGTIYRVHMGPARNAEELERLRRIAAEAGIERREVFRPDK